MHFNSLYTCAVGLLVMQHTCTHTHTHTGHQPPKPLRFLERVEKPVPRPPTPCVASPTEEEEDDELAVVLLQRVLRGRAIQAKVRHTSQNMV